MTLFHRFVPLLLGLLVASAPAESPPLDDPAVVEKLLAAKLPLLDKKATNLESAMAFLGELGGVNVLVDTAALRDAGYKPDQAVTVTAKDITLKTAIDNTVASISKADHPLKWGLENGVVVVSTEADQSWRWLKLAANNADQSDVWKDDRVLEPIDFDDFSLEEALKRLREQQFNFYFHWAAMKDAGIDPHNRVTLKLKRVRPRTAVAALIRRLGGPKAAVSFSVVDGIWIISTREDLDRLKVLWASRISAARDQASADKLVAVLQDVSFNAADFNDAANTLGRLGEVSIEPDWPGLSAAGIDRLTPISMDVRRVKLSTAIDLLLAEAGGAKHELNYTAKDSVIRVTLKPPAATKPATRPASRAVQRPAVKR